jgi:microcystin degradation protein MlrC
MRSNSHAHFQIDREGLEWLGFLAGLDTHKELAAEAGVDVSSVSRGINHKAGADVMSGLLCVAEGAGVSHTEAYAKLFRLVAKPKRRERVGASR